jgi:hypothetical protein
MVSGTIVSNIHAGARCMPKKLANEYATGKRRLRGSPAGDIGVDRRSSHAKACVTRSHATKSPAGLSRSRLVFRVRIFCTFQAYIVLTTWRNL